MTSRSCRVNVRATVLLVLVAADAVFVGRTTGVRIGHRQTSNPKETLSRTSNHIGEPADDRDASAGLESSVLRTLGLQQIAGSRKHRRRNGGSAAERVVVPEYMWQLYRRQRRANRDRQHRRSTAAAGDFTRPAYTANTIRSFVATSYSDTLTGQ